MFEHHRNTDEPGEQLQRLLTGSQIIKNCSVSTDGLGNRTIQVIVDEDEAANLCREQIHGLVEQALQAANAHLDADERVDDWKIIEDPNQLS